MLNKDDTTTTDYADNTIKLFPKGRKTNILIQNKHAANVALIKILGYVTEGDSDSTVDIKAEADLNGESSYEQEVTKVYEQIDVCIKTKTGTSHATFEIHSTISHE